MDKILLSYRFKYIMTKKFENRTCGRCVNVVSIVYLCDIYLQMFCDAVEGLDSIKNVSINSWILFVTSQNKT